MAPPGQRLWRDSRAGVGARRHPVRATPESRHYQDASLRSSARPLSSPPLVNRRGHASHGEQTVADPPHHHHDSAPGAPSGSTRFVEVLGIPPLAHGEQSRSDVLIDVTIRPEIPTAPCYRIIVLIAALPVRVAQPVFMLTGMKKEELGQEGDPG